MRNQLLCSTRLPSLITAAGSLPLFVYLLMMPTTIPVLFPQLYVFGILNFIAGINWFIALKENNAGMIIWSVCLALAPLAILIGKHCQWLTNIQVWVALLLLLWLSLGYDFYHRKKYTLPHFFCFRRSGTVFLTLSIVLIIIKTH